MNCVRAAGTGVIRQETGLARASVREVKAIGGLQGQDCSIDRLPNSLQSAVPQAPSWPP
ncbi:hypothetical protein Cadr_000008616 [Camelus dromedarius]|uniref:Uncharacterized protein n=1 Tax=Camelus dromedarius TaxID=9838 RepID=A0A5N4DZY1_CAMDR|nr:hypothetical protein Cadr_000008616 [Camelus dromedarius]